MGERAQTRVGDAPSSAWLALDIGGTSTRIGRFTSLTLHETTGTGPTHPPTYTPLARFATAPDYAAQLACIAAAVRGQAARWEGVGVSVGAQIAPDGRSVLTAPNLRDYIARPFVDDLTMQIGCSVRLAHDGICGVLGEHAYGALAGEERCAYVTLSTGTGAGVYLSSGQTALAISIQIGHQILAGNTLQCLCGQIGCLETLTGGRQLALRLGRDPSTIADPAFWDEYAHTVATGLINLAQLTRVNVVALGGGILLGHPDLAERVGADVRERISDATLEVRATRLGEDAPLLGAAFLPTLPVGTLLH